MADKPPITFFDMQTLPLSMQIMKAMIPFFDFPLAKMLSIIIRINELTYTMSYFNNTGQKNIFTPCGSDTNHIHSFSDILENEAFIGAVLPYIPPEYAGILKNYKMFSNMSSMFNIFKENETADTGQQNSFMNQSQQKMYDDYLKQLDSLDEKLQNLQ